MVVAAILVIVATGAEAIVSWMALCREAIAAAFSRQEVATAAATVGDRGARVAAHAVAPPLVAAVLAAVTVGLVQTRGVLRRLSGAERASSGRLHAGAGVVAAWGVLALAAALLASRVGDLARTAHARDASSLLHAGVRLTAWFAVRLAVLLAVWAALDFAWRWWRWRKSLRMTPQQVKEELRLIEGDALLRAERQRLAREAAKEGPPRA